jgi:hypothetical protein
MSTPTPTTSGNEGKDTKALSTPAATATTNETKASATTSSSSCSDSSTCATLCGGPLGKEICRLLLWNDIQRSGIVFGCGNECRRHPYQMGDALHY